MDAKQRFARDAILAMGRTQDALQKEIDGLAKKAIPDFHFLDHKVSMFWECEKSPIGLCVWDTRQRGFHIDCCCYYCKQPVERK